MVVNRINGYIMNGNYMRSKPVGTSQLNSTMAVNTTSKLMNPKTVENRIVMANFDTIGSPLLTLSGDGVEAGDE